MADQPPQEQNAPAAQPPKAQPPQQAPQQPAAQQQHQPFAGFMAEIAEVNTKIKTGIYGEIYTVSCKILEGRDTGRIIRRNMLGPVKPGDIVRLPDTSREAKQIKVK